MKQIIASIIVIMFGLRAYSQQPLNQTNNMKQIIESLTKKASEQSFDELPYSFAALEPNFDKATMEIHYSKHYKTYYNNLMETLKIKPEWGNTGLLVLFRNISKYPMVLRNNAGGFFNHLFFWNTLTPGGKQKPEGKLMDAIVNEFGSFDEFKLKFGDAAKSRFGSGWAWLIVTPDKKLAITSSPYQDNPYMDIAEVQGTPIVALDVWEHAYYLKYQNRRADYILSFWDVIDWNTVEALYQATQ
jgi:superoxide dismutase, Fe-Mn family